MSHLTLTLPVLLHLWKCSSLGWASFGFNMVPVLHLYCFVFITLVLLQAVPPP